MADRYFSTTPISAATRTIALTDDEARHLAQVMRAKVGDTVLVFDGRLHEGRATDWQARVVDIKKRQVDLEIISPQPGRVELCDALTLAVALPRGDRQKWLIEKCVELGVAKLVPLATDRGVAQPVESALERLRRYVLEATKQCGRSLLMEIDEPRSVADLCELNSAGTIGSSPTAAQHGYMAQPLDAPETEEVIAAGEVNAGYWQPLATVFEQQGSRLVLIGPEGGFSTPEVRRALASKWPFIDLGPFLLRVETAALQIASGHLQAQTATRN